MDNEIIKIGANFHELIFQNKDIKKRYKKYEDSNIWFTNYFRVSSIVTTDDGIIESYRINRLNSTTAKNYLSQWENEFGKEAISKFTNEANDVTIYCLQSPYSKTVNIIKFVKAEYSWIEGEKNSRDYYDYGIQSIYTKID